MKNIVTIGAIAFSAFGLAVPAQAAVGTAVQNNVQQNAPLNPTFVAPQLEQVANNRGFRSHRGFRGHRGFRTHHGFHSGRSFGRHRSFRGRSFRHSSRIYKKGFSRHHHFGHRGFRSRHHGFGSHRFGRRF